MREYDLYVPRNYNDGSPVKRKIIRRIKQHLADQFGGVTEIHLRKRGWWKLGTVTFRDKIVIFQVFTKKKWRARRARQFFAQLKEELKEALEQEEILVIEKKVRIL